MPGASCFRLQSPAAPLFGGTAGVEPLNYLQIYSQDTQYAAAHAGSPVPVIGTGGASTVMSAQDLLNLASQKLLQLSEPVRPLHAPQPRGADRGVDRR